MIPFTPGDLRINATIRHELIIDTLVALARGNRGNTATPRNLPCGIGVQIGKVRVHGMSAMVVRDLGLDAIRQKLPIDIAAADHPRNGLIGNRGERLVEQLLVGAAVARNIAPEHRGIALLLSSRITLLPLA